MIIPERLVLAQDSPATQGEERRAAARIFLLEDHYIVREGLRSLIGRQLDLAVVGDASGGLRACHKIRSLQPDLVLMDIAIDGCSGIETVERIKREWPDVKILVFTLLKDPIGLRELLQKGISGYVLKSSAGEEIIKGIQSVLKGGLYLDPELGDSLLEVLRQPTPSAARTTMLSKREEAVLKQVAIGYSNKEIAAQLGIGIKTVETHKSRAMTKLSLGSRVELIQYAAVQGWLKESGD